MIFKPLNKDPVGRQEIKSVSYNVFQNLTILPTHTHSSFPFLLPGSHPTLFHSPLTCFLKPSHHAQPHLMSLWLNKDHLLFLPGILNISPLNSRNFSKHPFNPRKVSFQKERFAVATDMGAPRAKPS